MNRKYFIAKASLGLGAAIMAPRIALSGEEKPPALQADMVREFVGAGHNNLERVKQMLNEAPNLLYAKVDWGGGDFESALEGAGHVGDRDIANYLISKGARANIFVLAMLGKTQIVKSLLEAYPEWLYARGPHGYSLLHHTNRGGEEAAELGEFLASKGLKETRFKLF